MFLAFSGRNKKKQVSGEIELSGYFETGWRGEGEEEISEKQNLGWLIFALVFVMMGLLARLTYLQVFKHSYYSQQSENNRIRKMAIAAPRGVIYDSNHRILATNIPQFDLSLVPALVEDDESKRKNYFKQVADFLHIDASEIEKKYSAEKKESFVPVVIKENLDRTEALRVEAKTMNWPGFILDKKAKRFYPEKEKVAHIMGYIGKISEEELQENRERGLNDLIGKDGLEQIYENFLRGEKGSRQLEVNSKGETTRFLRTENPKIGKSLVLSLDMDLQNAAFDGLRDQNEKKLAKGGAVVALDPRDGSVLALANYPSFDNNDFINKISAEKFGEITAREDRPLFNRAIGGTYPPGSTFKPLVALAALEKGIIRGDEVLDCPESLQVGSWQFRDWKYHGPSDMKKAIAESVNPFFYIIGGGYGDKRGLGQDSIKDYATLFGMGEKLGIDIPQERAGLVPDQNWKKSVKNEPWYIGDTYHVSIGQGDLLATPIQISSYISAIVNGGKLFKPKLLDRVEEESLSESEKSDIFKSMEPETIRENLASSKNLEEVKLAMKETVTSASGSARSLQDLEKKYGVAIGGKTGTAQTGEEEQYHALFVGFAPVENPEIVVTAMVEKGGEGYDTAIPVVYRVLEAYFNKNRSPVENQN